MKYVVDFSYKKYVYVNIKNSVSETQEQARVYLFSPEVSKDEGFEAAI
jgi:hypothetical protein